MILNKIKINDTATVTPGVVYDISKTTGQTYETLSDALSGNNVPSEVREGGMSVRFVHTGDNKYVQYRYMSSSTAKADFINVANWQGVDSEPVAGSKNLVESRGVWLNNIQNLFAPDSDFSKPLNCILSYTIKPGLDMSKDYYIKYCGIRRNDFTNVLFRIVNENDVTIFDTFFDGSDLGLHIIDAGYFVFTIDVSKIENNSSGSFTEYHYHLYKNSYTTANEYIDPILSSDITTSTTRLSQNLSLNDYKGQSIIVSISSPIDEDIFIIYGCNDDGSINNRIKLTPNIDSGIYSEPFNVPENGYIWLFTNRKTEVGIEKTYNVTIGSGKYLPAGFIRHEYEIQNNKVEIEDIKQTKLFTGKTIVCFGDSITEFKGADNKRYSDYLADISDATVINVGIGGTRLQQRTVPTTDPINNLQAYAALDIVNMVKASCEQDFTLQIAAAQYVSDHPQYVDIVARLQSIDWSTVSAVTILGGTNDWTGSELENVGTHGSTDPNTTLGAINYMLQMLSYTYPEIPVYFFTPLMRYIDQDFESAFTTSKAFTIGQHVLYKQKLYAFISDHSAGDWNANEVRRLTMQEMYNISSDIIVRGVGMNLKAFSQLIADEVKYNHISICDMYNEMWNAYNYTEALTIDLTHPRNGNAIIAQKIFGFINANRKFN